MRGKIGLRSRFYVPEFSEAFAVILESGDSYAVPDGATTMKAWAVSSGDWSVGRGGSVAYKTWSVTGGELVLYSLGGYGVGPCEVTYDGTTITASLSSPYFSGGDGGVRGGPGTYAGDFMGGDPWQGFGGAVGGNDASPVSPCNRRPATDVSGLLAAVALAGGKATEDCTGSAAFGSGEWMSYDISPYYSPPGIGGGSVNESATPGGPAVVLYFT